MKPARRWLRRLVWSLVMLAALGLVLWAAMTALMRHWLAQPPVLAQEPAIVQQAMERAEGRVRLGRNWFEERDGLKVLYLTGSPFELGFANGALTQTYIHRQEDTVLELLRKVAPYEWTQFLLKFLVTYKNRHLLEHIPEAYRMEMLGLSRGCPDPHPEVGPHFHRIVNYHAAQDISYMMMNSPLLRGGCTGFGAWGPKTQGGRLVAGRNFDWEPARVFDEDRILILCEPDEGIPFVSLAWGGMAGCVSGMNRAGLAIAVNGAPSRLPGEAAAPTCIVARDVIQHARTIAEAVEIIRRHRVFVSAMFLVGSRQDGRFVVVEKTPEQTVVREPDDPGFIVCANHYMTPELTNDPVNLSYVQVDTSLSRYARMAELLQQETGRLDAAKAAQVLRDRRLPGGVFPGNGHRGALNPLIATHSVVMDLTDGVFWAGTSPHQLGRFIGFDVNQFDRRLPDRTLAEDPILSSGELQRYRGSTARIDEGWTALKQGDATRALECAAEAEKENPGFYRNAWLRAESLLALHRRDEAAQAARLAQAGKPPLGNERQRIDALLAEAEGSRK